MQPTQVSNFTRDGEVLAVSLELATKKWKVALDDGKHKTPMEKVVAHAKPGERVDEVVAAIAAAKKKWALPPGVRVVVVFEAGQDGFWIQRALAQRGIEALMVDPASIPVERRARRAKTDRLDALLLVRALRGWLRGEWDRMKVVRVPPVEAEGLRHYVRERGTLQKEIGQHRDRLRKLLRTVGCWDELEDDLAGRLERGEVRCHDGSALSAGQRERLVRECARLKLAEQQLAALEKSLPAKLPEPEQRRLVQLMQLKAVGEVGALRLLLELFWRKFNNRRELGACVGLVSQPYDSGESRVDQGISKAGNRRVRALLIEMAWMWLKYQPQSELAQWFAKRTSGTGATKRSKRMAIVAVARRLVILLWRYLEQGVLPKDVELKPVKVKLQPA
jgi:transposase